LGYDLYTVCGVWGSRFCILAPVAFRIMYVTPCIGSGFCCKKAPCEASLRAYGNHTRCPGLAWDESQTKYVCRLMQLPGKLGENYRKELYAGEGCCANIGNTHRKDIAEGRRPPEIDYDDIERKFPPLSKELQMFAAVLGRQFLSGDAMYLTLCDLEHQLAKEFSKEYAEYVIRELEHFYKQQRSSFQEGFMG